MEIITSVNNPIIKELKKQMIKNNLLFLDSPKLIKEALKSGYKPIKILVENNKSFDFLNGYEIITVSNQIIKCFSQVESNQGVIAVIKIEQKKLDIPRGNFLILDNVQDAGNVGTLIRSALGANFKYVYLLNSAKITNIKTVRSSMGACFNLNIYECDKKDFINFAHNNNLKIYYCDMKGENIYNKTFDNDIIGVVVGNEGNGVSTEIKNISKGILKLPMNNKLESLNAGVSGSIIMYQITYGGNYVRT